ncbi:MAG: hypothetical protein UT00_C0033G0006 [Parcubacteria group bacterium GW2011_GWA1_38_7]|nr:MAG: hypothetical protein UT00_C0033G0006 [Parcubacteria group bacterium GW2011_GWA1_38_7]
MSAYKLLFNLGKSQLEDTGSAFLTEDLITIKLDPHSQALLQREGKLIKLAESGDIPKTITGKVKQGDVYTIGTQHEKLVANVEETIEKKFNFNLKLPQFSKKQIFLKEQDLYASQPQGKKTTLTVGIVLLVLLIVSVVFGIRQKNIRETNRIYKEKLEKAISSYQESLDLFAVDKTKARQLFMESSQLANEVAASKYKDERTKTLVNEINTKQGEILGEYKSTTTEFLDLTLQTSSFNGSQIASSGEDMFILDKKNKKIIKVNIKTKKTSLAADTDQVEGGNYLGAYEDRFYLMKDDGIYELGGSSEDKVLEKDWDNPFFYLYSANLYLLDRSANKIFRYSGTTDGFGSKSDWIAPGIEADFSKVVDITIDGSIWLLSSSGKVSKFTLGNPQSITLDGIPENMDNPTAIYTNEELKNVYILDSKKGRVVVIDKTGDFVVQYVADDIKNAKDLVVSENENKIILLVGGKLLTIDLKN